MTFGFWGGPLVTLFIKDYRRYWYLHRVLHKSLLSLSQVIFSTSCFQNLSRKKIFASNPLTFFLCTQYPYLHLLGGKFLIEHINLCTFFRPTIVISFYLARIYYINCWMVSFIFSFWSITSSSTSNRLDFK